MTDTTYLVRWLGQGRLHEAFFRQLDTAELVFHFVLEHGEGEPEIWSGARCIKKGTRFGGLGALNIKPPAVPEPEVDEDRLGFGIEKETER